MAKPFLSSLYIVHRIKGSSFIAHCLLESFIIMQLLGSVGWYFLGLLRCRQKDSMCRAQGRQVRVSRLESLVMRIKSLEDRG